MAPNTHEAANEPIVTSNVGYGALEEEEIDLEEEEIGEWIPTKPIKESAPHDVSGTPKSNMPASRFRDSRVLIKTQSSFWEDATQMRHGTIPHSIVVATTIGFTCGVVAFVYYAVLEWILDLAWHKLPEIFVIGRWPEWAYILWIPIVGFTMAFCVGLTVAYMGEPGDLPYTIKCVHEKAYVAMSHVLPMVFASQFSIIGGGSLGPEAPLVAICASLGGFISRQIFGQTDRNMIRKHTLMGMAGALAAFFGCPLGGSLFAMEVNSRFGIEYFEHTIEAIFCGEICLVVFRGISRLPIQPIWEIALPSLDKAVPIGVIYGILLGLLGSLVAFLFARTHWTIMDGFSKADLLRNERAIPRAMVGATVVVGLGMMVPHTMFWGEEEIKTIATLTPTATLPHVWPTHGLFGFEMNSAWTSLLVGTTKLVAISFTVSGGYRGGYIFPAMASGVALGRAIYFVCPFIPAQLCCLCMAAAITVGITRTAIATTLILAYLAGEPNSIPAVLASSLVALFSTAYVPFIKTQMVRSDLEDSLYCMESDDDPEDCAARAV